MSRGVVVVGADLPGGPVLDRVVEIAAGHTAVSGELGRANARDRGRYNMCSPAESVTELPTESSKLPSC
jgi:hypothetical protein